MKSYFKIFPEESFKTLFHENLGSFRLSNHLLNSSKQKVKEVKYLTTSSAIICCIRAVSKLNRNDPIAFTSLKT